jgi:hypothetical protein
VLGSPKEEVEDEVRVLVLVATTTLAAEPVLAHGGHDGNGDGTVTLEEIDAAHAAERAQRHTRQAWPPSPRGSSSE